MLLLRAAGFGLGLRLRLGTWSTRKDGLTRASGNVGQPVAVHRRQPSTVDRGILEGIRTVARRPRIEPCAARGVFRQSAAASLISTLKSRMSDISVYVRRGN